jgi:hypothetical protein
MTTPVALAPEAERPCPPVPEAPKAPKAPKPKALKPPKPPKPPKVPKAKPRHLAASITSEPDTERFPVLVPGKAHQAEHRLAAPAAWTPKVWRPRSAAASWWQPLVLLFALLLSVAMLLMPQAVQPRTIVGTPLPGPAVPSTGPAPAVRVPASAELPDGPPVTPSGSGSWDVVPGATGAVAGTGEKQLTYTVEVEGGIDAPSFASDVDAILGDPRGWIGQGEVSFRRIDGPDADPAFRIGLTSPETSRRPDLCGFEIPYDSSCHLSRNHRIVINLARWVRGAHAFDGDLADYRRYAINHEVGHALGYGHVGCPATGAPAPVMMQQTFGLSNTYLAELNRAQPGAAAKVHPDGAVCRPNAWVTTAS